MKKLLPLLARLVLVTVLLVGGYVSFGQGKGNSGKPNKKPVPQAAIAHLKKNKQKLQLSDSEIADMVLSSETESKKSGVKHLYLQQQYQGIDIHNALTTMSTTKGGEVVNMTNRFEKETTKRVKATGTKMPAAAAVAAAARHLNTSVKQPLTVLQSEEGADEAVLLSSGGISLESIPAKLVYQPMEDGSLRLAWEVSIYELDAQNWWTIRVDAATGAFLDKDNLVVHCEFDNDGPGGVPMHDSYIHNRTVEPKAFNFASTVAEAPAANVYNVFPLVTESPSHGPRVFIGTDAADKAASPKGWHYTPQGNMTTTRGNNVYAYEDPNNLNPFPNATNNYTVINYSPDGGPNLKFDFPVDFTKQPVDYRDAATTNLFYWNNLVHDVWYQYGFDEASGNFQFDNFGKGGLGNDFVRAEAQDSRNIPVPPPGVTTRNNANFGTPADGSLPRMQMYLWNGIPDKDMFQVTAPAANAGSYPAQEGAFSRKLTPTPVTGKLVVAETVPATATGKSEEGCGTFTNAAAIVGNIAVVYRGNCGFADKVQNAQLAGAIAVVVINNIPSAPIVMGGAPTNPVPAIVIPAVMIGQADGKIIRDLLDAKTEVAVALKSASVEIDGDFDNGIIAHEYGHGISNRLTGGPNIVNCLNNAEQMGEGWSDWFGLMMTIKPGDTGAKVRGIGTYASGQPTTGGGIRPAPYSTNFGVNNFTYAATNNPAILQPHGIGFVWATMIWDMNWALVDKYGYDADLYNGKGGNNIAMQLVIDGLKLQACRPGFVDGRDAILLADRINYGGANQELIWKVFAKRGLGFSAKQGLNTSRSDQVEAFDLPAAYLCTAPLTIAAVPTSDVYTYGEAKVVYLGYETVMLQAQGDATNKYTWTPATGLSNDTIANPVFTPTATGTYTFTVKAVNADQCTKTASIEVKVIDVRCGNKLNKVEVCFKGKPMCVAAADAATLLSRKGGEATLGACGLKATATSASLAASGKVAEEVTLTASPNPTSARTTLAFTLTQSGAYRLEVLNMQGAVIAVVAEGSGKAGESRSYEFSKGRLATGIYMVRLTSGKQNKFTRIVLQD